MNIPDKIIECNLESLEGYNFPVNKPFNLVVYADDIKYEFLVNLKDTSDKLLILAPGSIPNKHDRTKPYYERYNWYFEESTIFINDPTTYINNEITTGWGLGTIDNWYLETIAEIISKISRNLYKYDVNNQYSNLMFYGSLSGGYMAIMLSILVKNSISIAEVPQLEIFRSYPKPLIKHVFKNMSLKQIHDNYEYRLSIIELIKKEKYIPRSVVLLDYTFDLDLNKEYFSFFQKLCELPYIKKDDKNNINVRIIGRNKGHETLKPWQLRDVISNVNKIIDTSFYDVSTIHKNKIIEQEKKIKEYEEKLKNEINQISINNKEIAQYQNELKYHLEKIHDNDKLLEDYKIDYLSEEDQIQANDKKIADYQVELDKLNRKIIEEDTQFKEYKQESTNKYNELKEKLIIRNKVTLEYYKLKGSLKKKLILWIPYVYILLKTRPFNETFINIRLYRALQDSEWFNVGFYLVVYHELSRKKWCKFLTPETHYVCYGFNEKKLPHEDYTCVDSKKELLRLLKK